MRAYRKGDENDADSINYYLYNSYYRCGFRAGIPDYRRSTSGIALDAEAAAGIGDVGTGRGMLLYDNTDTGRIISV